MLLVNRMDFVRPLLYVEAIYRNKLLLKAEGMSIWCGVALFDVIKP